MIHDELEVYEAMPCLSKYKPYKMIITHLDS